MNGPLRLLTGTTGKVATAVLIALTAISLLGQLTIATMVDRSSEDAQLVSHAGLMSTLSQRAALLALDFKVHDDPVTAREMVAVMRQFRHHYTVLTGIETDPAMGRITEPARSELVRLKPDLQRYFSGILAATADESRRRITPELANRLVDQMDYTVQLAQRTSQRNLSNTLNQLWQFAALQLLVAIGLGFVLVNRYLARDQEETRHLRDKERVFNEMFEYSPLIQYSVGADGRISSVNAAWELAFGYRRSEVVGESVYRFIAPNDRARIRKLAPQVEAYTDGQATSVRFARRDGSTFPAEVYLTEAHQAKNRVATFNVIAIDKSEAEEARIRADHHIRQFEESFRFSPVALFSANSDGAISRANPAFLTLAAVESCRQIEDLDLGHLIRVAAKRLKHRNSPGEISNKQTIFDAAGNPRDVIMSMRLGRSAEGRAAQIEGAISDITELETVKRQVQNSRARFRSLYDETPIMLCSLDQNLRVSDTNEFMCGILNKSHDELRNTEFATLFKHQANESFADAFGRALRQENTARVESLLMVNDHQTLPCRLFARPVYGRAGKLQTVFVTLLDLSDVAEAERARDQIAAKLRTAEKLEAVGQLAAGIAHEINTPCQYVTDNLSFISQALDEILPFMREHTAAGSNNDSDIDLSFYEQEMPDAIEQSICGMSQITKIVSAMKTFSHPGGDTKDHIDLNKLVESVATVARNEWKYIAELEFDLDPAVGNVPCSSSSINQVMLNMVVNAAHAMEGKFGDGEMGRILLSTRRHADAIEITIEDNGSGIPEEHLNQVFNPFFTTKEVGKGTGQGLAIAHRIIVDEHSGSLSVDSTLGKGTRFQICLPHTAMENVA